MTASDLPYNRSLGDLELLLTRVQRPGDFCRHGALALPMPLVEVEGVGSLSFPLLEAQAEALMAVAERAPYGRGEQTVLDTSVRRVWQIDAARVRLAGKHWAQSLRQVLAEVGHGLGCEDAAIRAGLYKAAFGSESAPRKLVWLMEHRYSQAGLGFDALKGVDAALVGVLRRAAAAAACDVDPAVMNIEEAGPAEVRYAPSRGRRYRDEFEADDIDAAALAYEVVEVSDTERYIDHWIAADGRARTFGRVPLADGELLPAGALDDEPRDEDRLLEATGNEGVSFERAYRRAALVVWPRAQEVDVLLQAGIGSALPALESLLAADGASADALAMAERIVACWSQQSRSHYVVGRQGPLRVGMLRCLARFGATATGEQFMQDVLVADYDGSENAALADAAPAVLAAPAFDRWLHALLEAAFLRCPRALCELLFLLEAANLSQTRPDHGRALRRFAEALVGRLPSLADRPPRPELDDGPLQDKVAADSRSCHHLLAALERLATEPQRALAVSAMIALLQVFDPARVLVPALQTLCASGGGGIAGDAQRLRLWRHCCTFLLARSEFPPPMPQDWRQPVALSCHCDDCRALQAFALDPRLREQRFRVRQDRREHLQSQIEQHGLDMDHVTERTGSPQTLACRKTRASYRRQCRQHAEDVAAMRALQALAGGALDVECSRLDVAAVRQPQATEG